MHVGVVGIGPAIRAVDNEVRDAAGLESGRDAVTNRGHGRSRGVGHLLAQMMDHIGKNVLGPTHRKGR